jgi:hypothetical protein
MVQGGGVVQALRDVPDGFDLFEYHFAHNEDVRRPNSYGGLSGSAIWRTDASGDLANRLLQGIAFYESGPNENGERIITCHGPRSVYEKLVDLVAAKYGNRFRDYRKLS